MIGNRARADLWGSARDSSVTAAPRACLLRPFGAESEGRAGAQPSEGIAAPRPFARDEHPRDALPSGAKPLGPGGRRGTRDPRPLDLPPICPACPRGDEQNTAAEGRRELALVRAGAVSTELGSNPN